TRGDAEPGEPRTSVDAVHQNIGRLDVLVHEVALVRLAQRGDDADGEAQEAARLYGLAEQPLEWFAAWILDHQHSPIAVASEVQRAHCPCAIQFILQPIFVGEAFDARR